MSSEKLQGVVIDGGPVFDRLKEALALKNDAALARELGVSPKKLSVWRLRKFVPFEFLVTLCSRSGLVLDWVLTGEGNMMRGIKQEPEMLQVKESNAVYGNDFVMIPQMAGRISAGGGLIPEASVELQIAFRKEWIGRRGDPKEMSLIRVSGDSMEPSLFSGDLVLVDHGRNYIDPQGGIYAIAIDSTIMIKRLQVLHPSNMIKVISDNVRYEPIETNPDCLKINGKVIWFGREIGK